jgi:hypothetical protein
MKVIMNVPTNLNINIKPYQKKYINCEIQILHISLCIKLAYFITEKSSTFISLYFGLKIKKYSIILY